MLQEENAFHVFIQGLATTFVIVNTTTTEDFKGIS